MHRVITNLIVGGLTVLSAIAPASVLAQATQTSQDGAFRVEWSKDGRKVNGYVYNTTNRHAGQLQLLVEGVDPSGKVLAKTPTWVREIPPNDRVFFDVAVPDAPSYRVAVVSYKWIQEIASIGDRSEVN